MQAGQWDPLLFLPARGPAGPTKPTAAEQADTSISTPTHPGTRIRSVHTIPSQPIMSTPPRQGKAVAASQPPLPSPRRGNPSQPDKVAGHTQPQLIATPIHCTQLALVALHKSIATRLSRRSSAGTAAAQNRSKANLPTQLQHIQQSPRTHSTRNYLVISPRRFELNPIRRPVQVNLFQPRINAPHQPQPQPQAQPSNVMVSAQKSGEGTPPTLLQDKAASAKPRNGKSSLVGREKTTLGEAPS